MYFFDLDGTLLDSNGIWLDIDIEFLGRRGISPVPEDYTDYVTHHSARRARLSGRLPPPGDTDGGAHLLHASPVPRRPGAPPPSGLL